MVWRVSVGSGSARPGLGGEAVMVRITSSGEGGDAYRGSRGATRLVRVRMASFFRGSLGRRGGYGWCSEGGEVGHRSQGRQVQSGPGRVGRRVQVCRGSRGEAVEERRGRHRLARAVGYGRAVGERTGWVWRGKATPCKAVLVRTGGVAS